MMSSNQLKLFDNKLYVDKSVVTDYDKLIDRQLERAAITRTAGFSKIFTEASKALSC